MPVVTRWGGTGGLVTWTRDYAQQNRVSEYVDRGVDAHTTVIFKILVSITLFSGIGASVVVGEEERTMVALPAHAEPGPPEGMLGTLHSNGPDCCQGSQIGSRQK